MTSVEEIVAQEMSQMSLTEREQAYEELHGVVRVAEETPAFVAQCMQELDQAVRAISKKDAYDLAERLNFQYVHDPKFRLMFLRADYFDAEKAAARLVKFMEEKLKYFGPQALARPLFLSDLDDEDTKTLESGKLQILPSRDRSGRTVMCDCLTMFPKCYKNVVNLLKSFIYIVLCAAEDEETQIHGLVGLYFHMGTIGHNPPPELFNTAVKFPDWFPVRFRANHVITNRPFMPTFMRIALLLGSRDFRTRYRVHDGTHTECQYSMMTFGIPVDLLPVTLDGELKVSNHLKWIIKRRVKDLAVRTTGHFNKIDLPGRDDVLVGKGKPFQDHRGNVVLRQLVELRLEEYNAARKGDKTTFTRDVVQLVKGRFVKKDKDGWWEEVSEAYAREKVVRVFGSLRMKSKTAPLQEPVFVRSRMEKRARVSSSGCCGKSFDYT